MANAQYPRDLAVRILTRVLSDHDALDAALSGVGGEVSGPARTWLLEVCSGTLRWKGRLDLALDSTALKKKPSGWLRKILLTAAYQLVAQDRVTAAAIVSDTVAEVKRREGEAPAKFANACLRKISDHGAEWRALKYRAGKDAASWASLPEWFWKKLVKQHGETWACEFAKATLERPTLWISARDEQFKPDWAEAGPVPRSWRAIEGGSIVERDGFRAGQFIVQDISSQTLVHEISELVQRHAGENATALDLCAAPGGKAAALAWRGFQVTATDRAERTDSRYALLEQTVARVAPTVKVVARNEAMALAPQDLVWVDAPCSGSGIIRRHPDVRWLRREAEIGALIKVQRELLREAWGKVKPGGFLAYSVCSVLKEEGPEAIAASKLGGETVKDWFLAPQLAPLGDGFWATLLRKPT